jgi:hypothetical protein
MVPLVRGGSLPGGKAVLSDVAFLPKRATRSQDRQLPNVTKMAESQEPEPPKTCPVCSVAMMRQVNPDGTLVYRCYSCGTEIKMK